MPKIDKCPPLANLYYGAPGHEKVDCFCAHQPCRTVGAGMVSRLVTVWREGKGHPTRREVCPRLKK